MLKCKEYFMVRTPSLPIEYLDKFEKQNKDIYSFIVNNEYLFEFFKKALLVSSNPMYNSFLCKPTDEKKMNDLNESLLKYFIRSTTRSTPYGYMAGVSIGKFDNNTHLKKEGKIIDIQADNGWLYAVIHKLESKPEIYKFLMFKFNPICYRSGQRLITPYYSNGGMEGAEHINSDIIKENNIKYTNLVQHVQSLTEDFVAYEKIIVEIKKIYVDVSDNIIEQFLYTLIENEILLSNLRIPVFCDNHLEYLIKTLYAFVPNCTELNQLIVVNNLIKEYQKAEEHECLIKLYSEMGKLYKSSNYIILNLGNRMYENTLSLTIKNQVEKLMNLAYYFPIQMNPLSRFIKKFLEEYGSNVRVPFLEIIDKNKFNGLSLVSIYEVRKTEKERKFENMLKSKLLEAFLHNSEEILLCEEDFKPFIDSELSYVKNFDVNFLISKDIDKYELYLAPCSNSSSAGAMLQRFSNCFEEGMLKAYNHIYKEINDSYSDEYILVELREYSSNGRAANVLNNCQNIEYYMAFGNTQKNNSKEILLKDISVGLTLDNKIFLYSEPLKKKIKFVQTNMLNPQVENEIIQFLLSINEQMDYFPERRFSTISDYFEFGYIPRIKLFNVTLSTKKWILNEDEIKANTFSLFCTKLKECVKKYKIDKKCYYTKGDNRMIVDINQELFLHILYKAYKKEKKLIFTELETDIKKMSLIKDNKELHYMGEFVFSLISDNLKKTKKNILNNSVTLLDKNRRIISLFDEGYVFLKIYCEEIYSNDILSIYIPEFIKNIQSEKYFFIRYIDAEGNHIRLRIKFETPEKAQNNFETIIKWMNELSENNIITKFYIDTYCRENNRYGGAELIDYYEDVFCKDSLTVTKILRNYSLEEKKSIEKWYIFGITFILMQLTNNVEEMLNIVDNVAYNEKYRKEYRKNGKHYIELINDILDWRLNNYCEVDEEIYQEKISLINYKNAIYEKIKKHGLTNNLQNIILSIIHMYCNRLVGNREYEEKYIELVRDALYHIVKSKKIMKEHAERYEYKK